MASFARGDKSALSLPKAPLFGAKPGHIWNFDCLAKSKEVWTKRLLKGWKTKLGAFTNGEGGVANLFLKPPPPLLGVPGRSRNPGRVISWKNQPRRAELLGYRHLLRRLAWPAISVGGPRGVVVRHIRYNFRKKRPFHTDRGGGRWMAAEATCVYFLQARVRKDDHR